MNKHRSFTLIEMLVVIFIIMLLIGISIVIFQRGDFDARDRDLQRRKALEELATAIESFKADKGHYPFINWGPGKHAYEAVWGAAVTPQMTADCGTGATYGDYTAFHDKKFHREEIDPGTGLPYRFDPGTEIRFTDDPSNPGQRIACDDLSLQLLGRAYLPKLPFIETNWDTNDANSVWNDPSWNYKINHGTCITGNEPNCLKYDLWSAGSFRRYLDEIPEFPPNPISPDPAFYNMYYDCACEKIIYGDRYWLEVIMELASTGGELGGDGFYRYEVGTMNWSRSPRTTCGC